MNLSSKIEKIMVWETPISRFLLSLLFQTQIYDEKSISIIYLPVYSRL